MLLNSHGALSHWLPEAPMHIGEAPDFDAPGMHFWFLETTDIERVPDRSLDAALNFNSFMEMDEQVRDYYIEQVYRATAAGAVFYNVNRMQREMTRRDGTTYANNPLLYPYRATDQVLHWEPDEMQQSLRAYRFAAPIKSFCISRMAIVA
jgi:hypothetical protein